MLGLVGEVGGGKGGGGGLGAAVGAEFLFDRSGVLGREWLEGVGRRVPMMMMGEGGWCVLLLGRGGCKRGRGSRVGSVAWVVCCVLLLPRVDRFEMIGVDRRVFL